MTASMAAMIARKAWAIGATLAMRRIFLICNACCASKINEFDTPQKRYGNVWRTSAAALEELK
jgi:hypothetical protein